MDDRAQELAWLPWILLKGEISAWAYCLVPGICGVDVPAGCQKWSGFLKPQQEHQWARSRVLGGAASSLSSISPPFCSDSTGSFSFSSKGLGPAFNLWTKLGYKPWWSASNWQYTSPWPGSGSEWPTVIETASLWTRISRPLDKPWAFNSHTGGCWEFHSD